MGRECGDKTCSDLVNIVIIVIIALVREVNQSKCLPGVKRIFVLPVPRLAAFCPHPPACQPARYESMRMRQQCNPGACKRSGGCGSPCLNGGRGPGSQRRRPFWKSARARIVDVRVAAAPSKAPDFRHLY